MRLAIFVTDVFFSQAGCVVLLHEGSLLNLCKDFNLRIMIQSYD